MKEKMSKAGYKQGDMSPHVADMQKPMKSYSQSDFNKTTEYIERQDASQAQDANKLRNIAYKGRYS